MDGSLALRRGWARGVLVVLDAGRPARDALHPAIEGHRTDDVDRQTSVERGANAAFIRSAARAAGLGEGGAAAGRDALPHAGLQTNLAMDRTAAAAAHAG